MDPVSPNYLDLLIDGTGDLVLTSDYDANGANPVLQNVLMALRAYRGEWFLNLNDGIPYYQQIFLKGVSVNDIQTIFHDAILDVPGVVQLNSLQVTLDSVHRAVNITFSALSTSGAIDYSGTLEYATSSDSAAGVLSQ